MHPTQDSPDSATGDEVGFFLILRYLLTVPVKIGRGLWKFVLFWKDSIQDFMDKDCQYIAGAIAFYALFSMFPLFLAVIAIVGFVIGPDAQDTQLALAREVGKVLPVSGPLVEQTLEEVVKARFVTGIVSLIGLIWASTAAFGAIRKGINAAWGVKEERRFLKKRVIDFVLVLGAGLVIFLLLFVSPAVGALRQTAEQTAPSSLLSSTAFWNVITRVVSPLLSFVSILLLYRYMPNVRINMGGVFFPALVASIAFVVASLGFVWYINRFSLYDNLYGSVGSILALLMWIYVSAMIVLFGALLASRFHGYSEEQLQRLMRLRNMLDRVR
ncbi:MAG: YihY/virulence factor BrkB family protein [Chloroflexi bacterium]|nr:YihY/virulence factor BrkB family protein [Chloroflexota bacterium]